MIEDFREDLTIEVRQGPQPTFVFRLPNGRAPAGLLLISVREVTTIEDVWAIVYGSSSEQLEIIEAHVVEEAETIQAVAPELLQQISAFYDSLAKEIPPV